MSGFSPADEENPTLADIARGINQVHACVDEFRGNQELVNASAIRERRTMVKSMGALKDDVRHVKTAVGDLKFQQDIDGGKITKLAQMFGAADTEPGEKRPKGPAIATWSGWKIIAALGGAVGLFVFAFQFVVAIAPAVFHYLMGLSPV